jgi:hypothetical protein
MLRVCPLVVQSHPSIADGQIPMLPQALYRNRPLCSLLTFAVSCQRTSVLQAYLVSQPSVSSVAMPKKRNSKGGSGKSEEDGSLRGALGGFFGNSGGGSGNPLGGMFGGSPEAKKEPFGKASAMAAADEDDDDDDDDAAQVLRMKQEEEAAKKREAEAAEARKREEAQAAEARKKEEEAAAARKREEAAKAARMREEEAEAAAAKKKADALKVGNLCMTLQQRARQT